MNKEIQHQLYWVLIYDAYGTKGQTPLPGDVKVVGNLKISLIV